MEYPKKWKCPNCEKIVENNRVCEKCKFAFSMHYPKLWNCVNCDSLVLDSDFCKNCNYPNNLSFPDLWHCHECSFLVKNSKKCENCGFELNKEPKKDEQEKSQEPKKIIEKKALNRDFLDKNKLFIFSAGAIILALMLILFSFDYGPQQNNEEFYPIAGQEFSKDFLLMANADRAEFEFISPSGSKIGFIGEKKENNLWEIDGILLNETGEWQIRIKAYSGASYFELIDSLRVLNACETKDNCAQGLCCDGVCFTPCSESNPCQNEEYCTYAGTCESKCVLREVPQKENETAQVEPITCPAGKIGYLGFCITPICLSNANCIKDGWNHNCVNPGTINSYCSYSKCESGQISCEISGINKCVQPACKRNSDCPVNQVCENPWQCNARCIDSPYGPSVCFDGKMLCNKSCIEYSKLCEWPKSPSDSSLCECIDSPEILSKQSDLFEFNGISAENSDSKISLSMLCDGCNQLQGHCFDGKRARISYSISYNGDSIISAPMLGFSKAYSHIPASSPPQYESLNEIFYGTISCASSGNLTLSSELNAQISNVKIHVQREEMVQILIDESDYSFDACPAFDNSNYSLFFDIDYALGNFSINFGLDRLERKISFNETIQNAALKGQINCSLGDSKINFELGDEFSDYSISGISLFASGCYNDFDCAKNEFDKCSISKCVNNKCITSRLNFDYCNSSAKEYGISLSQAPYSDSNYAIGSYYLLNSSICEKNANHGKDYLLIADIESLNGQLLIGYEADSKGSRININAPQRVAISGKIDCLSNYKAVIFYLPISGGASGFIASNFGFYIKDFEMIVPEASSEPEPVPQQEECAPIQCPFYQQFNMDACACIIKNPTKIYNDLNTGLPGLFSQTADASISTEAECNNYHGREYYLLARIRYKGAGGFNMGFSSETDSKAWNENNAAFKTIYYNKTGAIDCSLNELQAFANYGPIFGSQAIIDNIYLYVSDSCSPSLSCSSPRQLNPNTCRCECPSCISPKIANENCDCICPPNLGLFCNQQGGTFNPNTCICE